MHCWPTCIAHFLTLSILTKCQNCLAALAAICFAFVLIAAKSAAETQKNSPTSGPLNSRLSMLCAGRDADKRNFLSTKSSIIPPSPFNPKVDA